VNLVGDLVDLEMLGESVQEDEVGLKMKSRMERAPAMFFLADQISAGCLQRRSDNRGEMRFMIDQEYALGKSHGLANELDYGN
jgi:hypothetical protein